MIIAYCSLIGTIITAVLTLSKDESTLVDRNIIAVYSAALIIQS